jgi:hypothetical protein
MEEWPKEALAVLRVSDGVLVFDLTCTLSDPTGRRPCLPGVAFRHILIFFVSFPCESTSFQRSTAMFSFKNF